jgi:hypothetical protein
MESNPGQPLAYTGNVLVSETGFVAATMLSSIYFIMKLLFIPVL